MDGFISPIYDDLRLELKQKKWWKPILEMSQTCSKKIFTIRCVPLSRPRKSPDNAARLDFKNFMLRRLATGMFLFTDDWTRQNETRLDLR